MNHHNKQDTRVALITGGARRIGAKIAQTLHGSGFRVAIHCHQSRVEAQQLVQALNQQRKDSAYLISYDLLANDAGEFIITAVQQWAGRLDVLVNNAAIFLRTDFSRSWLTAYEQLFSINVKAPLALSIAARSLLAKEQGVIINITDIHAQTPLKDYAIYCQTKAALAMQTKTLAREFAPLIRVNAVAPGAIAWPEAENSLSLEIQKEIIRRTPLKCHGQATFIAQAVLALIDNPFITGQEIKVDGGRSIT